MKLMTKEIEARLQQNPLYKHDGEGVKAPVAVKYFLPEGCATWLVTEGEKQPNGDWLFFCYACLFPGEWEWGYTMLSQIEEIRGPQLGLPVERDLYLNKGTTVEEAAGIKESATAA